MGVKTTALAGPIQRFLVISAGETGKSCRHHYRVHKRGLPHIALRKDYLSKLPALLPVPMVLPSDTVSLPVELRDESP